MKSVDKICKTSSPQWKISQNYVLK